MRLNKFLSGLAAVLLAFSPVQRRFRHPAHQDPHGVDGFL